MKQRPAGRVRTLRALAATAALAALALIGFLVLAAGAKAATPADAGTAGDPAPREWAFRVLLDGKPIGTHRFSVATRGDERTVASDAAFDVKVMFVTAYRYRHHAAERWRGGCLVSLAARTEAGGSIDVVTAGDADAAGLAIVGPQGAQRLAGCVSTYAYWDPALPQRTQLLNPQTGRLEAVKFDPPVAGSIDVRGVATAARRIRLTGPEQPIDLWYAPSGAWIGLDSTVAGGRKLTYRLVAAGTP